MVILINPEDAITVSNNVVKLTVFSFLRVCDIVLRKLHELSIQK